MQQNPGVLVHNHLEGDLHSCHARVQIILVILERLLDIEMEGIVRMLSHCMGDIGLRSYN
jgi:hypothetical protein